MELSTIISIADIVSISISLLALSVAILVFWDNRKKTRIMENQLELLQEQDAKKEIRDAIRIVGGVEESVSRLKTDIDFGDFGAIGYIGLLEQLHDSENNTIQFKAKVDSILRFRASGLESFDFFRDYFEGESREFKTDYETKAFVDFSPKLQTDYIYVKDYADEIYSILSMYEQLKKIEGTVCSIDKNLIQDILDIYLEMLNAFYDKIRSETILEFDAQIKSEQIIYELFKIVAFDKWEQTVHKMKMEILPRIYSLKKELLKML